MSSEVLSSYIYKLGCLNECRDPVLRMAPVSRRALTPTFTFLHHHHQHHHHSHHSRRGHHHNHCHCKEKPMGSEWVFQCLHWDNPISVWLCVCTNWCLWNIWRGECCNPSGFHQRHCWRLQVERSNITNWRKYSEEKTGASSPAGVTPVAYTEYLLKQCVHLHQLVSLIFAEEIWHLHQLVNAIIWKRSMNCTNWWNPIVIRAPRSEIYKSTVQGPDRHGALVPNGETNTPQR